MINLGLLVLRLVIGLLMAAHGAQKIFGWWGGPGIKGWTAGMNRMRIRPATAWAWISALSEFVGGLLFALGLLTPLAAAAIVAAMLVAVALVHWLKGFWNSKGGFEFNLSIVAAAVAVALIGPGALSLDSAFGIHFREPVTVIAMAVLVVLGTGAVLLSRKTVEVAETKPQASA